MTKQPKNAIHRNNHIAFLCSLVTWITQYIMLTAKDEPKIAQYIGSSIAITEIT